MAQASEPRQPLKVLIVGAGKFQSNQNPWHATQPSTNTALQALEG